MRTAVVILAAGRGTRMKSQRPKALHELAGAPLIWHVCNTLSALSPTRRIIVAATDHEALLKSMRHFGIEAEIAVQDCPRGTADAARAAVPELTAQTDFTIIHYADTPLVTAASLLALQQRVAEGAAISVLGFEASEPGEFGRLKLGPDGSLDRIIEAADATAEERGIRLCNSGVLCAPSALLAELLDSVGSDNAQSEHYLTDIVAIAKERGKCCDIVECPEKEALGMNSQTDLVSLEAAFQEMARRSAAAAGVAMTAPDTVHFSYDTKIAAGCRIEPYVVFATGVEIGANAIIRSFSHLSDCVVGAGAEIGPFARLRPGAEIGERAKIGNFVEVKASAIQEAAKVPHLSYIGDAVVGARANIGAGSVTCNFDGQSKHRTVIGDGAAIGSGTLFVAPLEVGQDAMTGAGSVLTENVPDGALAIARQRQVNKAGRAAQRRSRTRQKSKP